MLMRYLNKVIIVEKFWACDTTIHHKLIRMKQLEMWKNSSKIFVKVQKIFVLRDEKLCLEKLKHYKGLSSDHNRIYYPLAPLGYTRETLDDATGATISEHMCERTRDGWKRSRYIYIARQKDSTHGETKREKVFAVKLNGNTDGSGPLQTQGLTPDLSEDLAYNSTIYGK